MLLKCLDAIMCFATMLVSNDKDASLVCNLHSGAIRGYFLL